MMPRAVPCLLLLTAVLGLQGEDAREIVHRVAEHDQQNSKSAPKYTYVQRQETRELDHAGQLKTRKIETWQVTYLDGTPYRQLVGRNDRPLAPDEQKAEGDRQRWNAEQRRMESMEERARRVAEWQRRIDRQRDPVKEMPDAFDFTLLGEEQLHGRAVYRIDGTPKAGFKPKSQVAAIFPKVKMHLWIDKSDYQGARAELEVLDSISFGGFLVRLSKGTRLVIEQAPVGGGVWLPSQFSLTAAARILLVKGLNRELDFTFSDYKPAAAGAAVVALAAKPQ